MMNDSLYLGLVGAGIAAVCLFVYILVTSWASDCDGVLAALARRGLPGECFNNTVVWVTGASSGIGAAYAEELAARGATLILSARREERLKIVAERCKALGAADVMVLQLDAIAFDTHADAVAAIVSKYGRIDVLVNNAGASQRALAEDTELEVDRQCLELNVMGPISITKATLPVFFRQNSGHIVVTSSVAGKLGSPCSTAYSAAKHATQGFFAALKYEILDRNVDITLVCPGPIDSEISKSAFVGKAGQRNDKEYDGPPRMPTQRCAFLMAVATFHRLDEVWISRNPVLLFTYLAQYMPGIAAGLGRLVGPNRVANFRRGVQGYVFNKPKAD